MKLNGREASILVIIAGAEMYVEGPKPIRLSETYTLDIKNSPAVDAFIKRLRNKEGIWMQNAIRKSNADPDELYEECEALAKRLEQERPHGA